MNKDESFFGKQLMSFDGHPKGVEKKNHYKGYSSSNSYEDNK
jgi:hypothetical protein